MAVLQRQLRAIERAHDYLDLSYRDVARALRSDESTLHRWRAGKTDPSPVFLDRLESLSELLDELERTFRNSEHARSWLQREVSELDDRRPADLLVEGRIERITAVLLALNLGAST
jgi:putative toxin-antitoxin system antitoxin component (TIGR02293 family)